MKQIQRIAVRAVRGIRSEVVVSLQQRSLVIRGDNGTGKSSIVHALRWALLGVEPPASVGADTEEGLRRHILEADPDAPRVVIDLAPKGRIEVSPQAVAADSDGAKFREACIRASPFLRRSDLLGFLTSKPGERFRYLESFLDLDVADRLRDALVQRAKAADVAHKESLQKLSLDLGNAAALLPVPERKPVSWQALQLSFARWARELHLDVPSAATWDDLAELAAGLAASISAETTAKRRAELTSCIEKLAAVELPAEASPLLAELTAIEAGLAHPDIGPVLEAAARYLHIHPEAESCPVCEQGIKIAALVERLATRVADFAGVARCRQQLVALGDSWHSCVQRLIELQTASARALAGAAPVWTFADAPIGSGFAAIESLVAAYGGRCVHVASEAVATLSEALTAALSAELSEAETDARRSLLAAFRHASEHQLAVELGVQESGELGRMAKLLKTTADAMKKARQEVAQELLNEIGLLVESYYTSIHPPDGEDEVTGAPRIEVQGHGGGTAYVRGRFSQREIEDPKWVYSDGHLDTVGICVFLALRRFRADRDKARDPKLMILDDVVLSIDLGHARRLLTVLRESFDDHQVLILTHNGLFTDWCAKHLPSYGRLAILRWSLERGPSLGEHVSARKRLSHAIESEGSPKLLAQAMMNLLDEWIADARYEYSISVQSRRGNEYTLNDLWEPFQKAFIKLTKTFPLGDVGAIIARLPDVVQMRNSLGAHENDFAKEFPLATVREVASDVLALIERLHCADCAVFALPVPSMSAPEIFRCRCERLRYVRSAKTARA